MHIQRGNFREAFRFGRDNFSDEELCALCEKTAKEFEKLGRLDDAEKLYLEIKKPELAIRMFKSMGQYDRMLRLFSLHRPENLKEAHNWIGKKLEEEDQLARAERHYLEASSWTVAVDMYEKRKMFEDCLRICKNFASDRDTVERAKRWDRLLSEEELVGLLRKSGLVGSLVDYFCEKKKFTEAFRAAEKSKHKLPDIHLAYAMHLEDEKQYKEAENEYILAGKYDQVVHMYLDIGDFHEAIQVARQYDHRLLEEIYLKQAKLALENGDLEKMEMCFISAKKPEQAVNTLSKMGRFSEAVRVARKHCPYMVKELNQTIEKHEPNSASMTGSDLENQLQIWEEAREWDKAIDICLEANENHFQNLNELEAFWDKAVQLSFNFASNRYLETVKIVCRRLRTLNRFDPAGEYYDTVQMHEEAVKCFLSSSNIERARLSCQQISDSQKQLEMKDLIDKSFKNFLRNKKDAEQLVGNEEIREGLNLMIERGDWTQALSVASSKEPSLFEFYLLKYLEETLISGRIGDCLKMLTRFGMPYSQKLLETYRKLVDETFALCDPTEINDLKLVLSNFMVNCSQQMSQNEKNQFQTFLFVSHLNQLRQLYESHQLTKLAADVSVSLTRYIHLITIDKPFLDAGRALRQAGNETEAFLFLNRYLDIYDYVTDPENNKPSESDEFKTTDIPDFEKLQIPRENLISEKEKTEIRDWLLAAAVKDSNRRFPKKKCKHCHQEIYHNCLDCPFCHHSTETCFMTGLPIESDHSPKCSGCNHHFRADAFKEYSSYFNHCPWCNTSLGH